MEKLLITKIYFDMDGVLADFDGGVKDFTGITPDCQGKRSEAQDDAMWAALKNISHFYDRLQPLDTGIRAFRAARELYGARCEILTGIPKPKRGIVTAATDKQSWVKRLLGSDVVVHIVYKEEKKLFCTDRSCVLVDDLDQNIMNWEASGGTGIIYFDGVTDVIRELQKIEEALRSQG